MTDRWKRLIPPIAGVALVACVVVAFGLMNGSPSGGDSGAKIRTWFEAHHNRALWAAGVMTYGGGMALVFFTGMAAYLRRRGSQLLAALTAGSGVILAVALLLVAGSVVAVTDKTSKLGDGALQAVNQIGSDLAWPAVIGSVAIATLAIGIASLRTHAFPKALGIVTVVVGVVGISGIGAWFAFLGSGPLTLVLAGYLYYCSGRPDSITLPDVPSQRETAEEPSSAKTTAQA